MYKATVHFETVVEAKAFVTASNEVDFKVELVSGPYIIDAKSIMGRSAWIYPSPSSCRPTARTTAPSPRTRKESRNSSSKNKTRRRQPPAAFFCP